MKGLKEMNKGFDALLAKIGECSVKKVSVANAQDDAVLEAVRAAKDKNIADAILVGDEDKIKEIAASKNIDISELKKQRNMSDVDDFDFICHIAYDKKPLTRKERYENVKKQDFISKYNSEAQDVIRILMKLYADKDIYEMEDVRVLDLDEFKPFGTKSKIVKMFGSIADYKDAIRDIESKLYEDDYKLVS